MYVEQLGEQYDQCARRLAIKIDELRGELKAAGNMSEAERMVARRRLNDLTEMRREAAETAEYLAKYYTRKEVFAGERNGNGKKLSDGETVYKTVLLS